MMYHSKNEMFDAGNLHVRFDEGEVAPAKPRRGSLLYKMLMMCMATVAVGVAFAAPGTAGTDNSKKMWGYFIHMTSNNWSDYPSSHFETDYHKDQSLRLKLHLDDNSWNRIINELIVIGANMLMIDVEDGVRLDSHPEIAVEGSWPKAKLAAEVQRLKKLGFTVIPKMNFSSSHDTWLKGWQDKLATPEYRKMCGEVIDEICEIFDHPKFFHIGMDEETEYWQNMQEHKKYRQGEEWWTDFLFMCAAVERNGARVMSWTSTVRAHPEEFMKRCPRSIVFGVAASTDYNRTGIDDDTKFLRFGKRLIDEGFDVFIIGSNWYCDENFRETIAWFEKHTDRTRIIGFMMCPWQVTIPAWDRAALRAVNYLEDAMMMFGGKEAPDGKRQPVAAWVNDLKSGAMLRPIYPEDRRIIMQTEEVIYDFGVTAGKQLTIDCMSFSKKDETITISYGDKLNGSRIADETKLAEFVITPGEHHVFKPGFAFPHGRYVSIRQTRQIHYTRLALVKPGAEEGE